MVCTKEKIAFQESISYKMVHWKLFIAKNNLKEPVKLFPKSPEPFQSTLQNMGIKFLQGVENFQHGEVLFVQAADKFLHAAKIHFLQL